MTQIQSAEHKDRMDMIVKHTTHEQRIELLVTCLSLIADMSIISERGNCEHLRELARDVLEPMSALLTKHHGEGPLKKMLDPYVRERAVAMMAEAAEAVGVPDGEAN